ncbi:MULTISPECIES: sulfite oxidase-like oxidoreductase [unclassified Thalassospira]|uniref:sulfite oxidase-like oxidoreductase n=1 Tax=unclassified Thalassospira TaxID=2648997 RepID=UPI000A1EDF64|nr:sulfite oxidase-like oxidoreductase [Thalassospira sp. MCCC 1A01428]OSQ41544.1 molybdopterin-binding protein [Thalassospira sp. MCCC 1A01428]
MTSAFTGSIREKLIAAKQQWAEKGRLLTGIHDEKHENRLPPGQREVKDWPVLDLGITPHIAESDWQLTITGEVENPVSLSMGQLLELPAFCDRSDIHCVTSWSRYENDWQGVSALELAHLVKPMRTARYVLFTAHDGYTTNVRIEQFLDNDVLLAHHWQDQPISDEHGGPVRVVIPKLYFWKSAKWVREIKFSKIDKPGFWEMRGYHNNADPWTEQRYD